MLKTGIQEIDHAILSLLNACFLLEAVPAHWKVVPVLPVYKKGCPLTTSNYRPIGLLSNIYKLYERILDARIRAMAHTLF